MSRAVSLGSVRNALPNFAGVYGTSSVSASFCRGLNPHVPITGPFALSSLVYDDGAFVTTRPLVSVRTQGSSATFQTTKTGPLSNATFAFWCFLASTTFDNDEGPVSIDDGTHAYVVDLEGNSSTVRPSFWGTRGGVSYSSPWPSNQWIFVAFVYNATSMTSSVYTRTGTTPTSTASVSFASGNLGNPVTTFAYLPRYPGHAQSYPMYVYDYRQYDSALTSSELVTLKDTGVLSGKSPVSLISSDGGSISERRTSGGQSVSLIGSGLAFKFFKQVATDGG